MDEQIDEQQKKSFWRRHWLALLVTGVGLVVCLAAIGLILTVSTVSVTPAQEQLARQALANPAGAPLHLGHMGDLDGWLKAGPNNYAVQDSMVIITPGPTRFASIFPIAGDNVADLKTPVVVYAPDGSDLSRRPTPPDQYGGYSGIQWFLYGCHAAAVPMWWGCTLLVGSSI